MTISTEERLERVERLVEANSQAIARLTQQQEELFFFCFEADRSALRG
jgi:hypothetical protein